MLAATRAIVSRRLQSTKALLGCGSNVIDKFFKVEALPKPGEKGYFASSERILERSLVGGVTLNHLAWAALLGVPASLLALQGDDQSGRFIRSALSQQYHVDTSFIKVSKDYTTSECFVFIQRDGERSIIMAPAATSLIDGAAIDQYFADAVRDHALMVSSEISQVPHSGVLKLLQTAKRFGITSVLDLDVSPSVAVNQAKLGSMEDLLSCVHTADILKPARHAAEELYVHLQSSSSIEQVRSMSSTELVDRIRQLCKSQMVAMTAGSEGCAISTQQHLVQVPVVPLDTVVDATGAGDAFLGGLLAGLYHRGFPQTKEDLTELGRAANLTGSICCQILGAVPDDFARKELKGEINKVSSCSPTGMQPNIEEFEKSLETDGLAASQLVGYTDSQSVDAFVDILFQCQGNVVLSGLGKSGIVGQRMASSLASTGTPAHFVIASEWAHGDYGKVRRNADVVVFVSHSGRTTECCEAARYLVSLGISVLSIVGSKDSPLALESDKCISYDLTVSEPLGGVPTSSIVLQEMLANAVIRELLKRRKFSKEDFGRFHPGGSLGTKFHSM
ncbi:uncharacterized protein LOC134184942 isoform X2 [Corticium candelabrum]|uniref:uncharacterized protein LOC134184942 isoform X2 n=1 Tax=Corticium candelabrum TaxID=121492 RepID=UPI002E3799DD|nr:uncharacterized protein LOC134184942 isoform X2 [Corticium candelabrum]